MKFKLYIILFLSFLNISLFGQTDFIQGEVIDSLTNHPIVGVLIIYNNQTILSDLNGKFNLKKKNNCNVIKLSHVSYIVKIVKINDLVNLNVKLVCKKQNLNSIYVKSNVFNIIIDAINKIPYNYYYNNESILNGVFKQELIIKNKNNDTINIIENQEALIDLKYPAYNNKYQIPEVHFITNERNIYYTINTNINKWYDVLIFGIQDINNSDFVLKSKSFLHKNAFKYFNYVGNGFKTLFNRKVLEINFSSKSSKLKLGTLYIDSITKAFVACNYYEYFSQFLEAPINYRNLFVTYSIDSNNKWSLNTVFVETDYKDKNKTNLKEYFFKNNIKILNSNDSILFKKMEFFDFRTKNIEDKIYSKIKDSIINYQYKNGFIKFSYLNKDSTVLVNKLKLMKDENLNKKFNSFFSIINSILYKDENSKFILYLNNNNKLYTENVLAIFNIIFKIRILKNIYYYTNSFNSVSSSNYNFSGGGQGLGIKYNFKNNKNLDCMFIYAGYELQKYKEKSNTIYSQGNIVAGINIETKLANKLNLLIDLKQTILHYKNYNNIVPQSNNKFFAGVGISFKF